MGVPETATRYRLQWKSGNQDWSSSRETTATVSPYTHSGRSAGTAYTYRVRGENVNGHSDWSNEDSATTDSASVAEGRLGTPMGVTVTDATDVAGTKLKVSWSKVPDADAYEVMKWSGSLWAPVTPASDDGQGSSLRPR